MTLAIIKIMPIILLIGLGMIIRKKSWLSEGEMNGFKKLVMNAALPAVLFLVFYDMTLQRAYITLVIAMMVFLFLLLGIGFLIRHLLPNLGRAFPYMVPGFSFGLLGIGLFVTAFPDHDPALFAIFGIGHEIFIWVFFISIMRMDLKQERHSLKNILGLLRSPLILAMLFGALTNQLVTMLGVKTALESNALFSGLLATLEVIAALGTPLILLYSGFMLVLDQKHVKMAWLYTLIRRLVVYGLGAVFLWLVFPRIIEIDTMVMMSWFFFLMVGPPLSLALFVGQYGTHHEMDLINDAVVVDVMLGIGTYVVALLVLG